MGAVERLKPPHDLTDEEVVEWVTVVNAEPAWMLWNIYLASPD